ncbi:MAG TPA: tRNA (adenosine(37)-N6)-threonylcarbamoyltransferase complex transferase subunit TsaD, partial [Candidatus Sulfotelmatobacter sp.]|nr:tRNA (adenosine(37)-N6)-threonylcarbamoyltransferase complex transferase subunit TsaD [Candidatus Sulfotelmatobacter sp.]
ISKYDRFKQMPRFLPCYSRLKVNILGIETSCDETAVAVVSDGYYLRSNVVASSMDLHRKYGGVVPEIAARSHIEAITPCLEEALSQAKLDWGDIDAIAVNYGAGLSGSLLIGVLTARTLAIVFNKPLYATNHIHSHIYANFITKTDLPGYRLVKSAPEFPFLALMVSGKHTQLVLFNNHFDYQVLGRTTDDAVGEAYDKVAKMLGLPYPGGPSVEKLALNGDPGSVLLPKTRMSGYDFSYSGLKTALLRAAQKMIGESYDYPSVKLPARLTDKQKANLAASFQQAAIGALVEHTKRAYDEFSPKAVVIAGGVAASQPLREQLSKTLGISLDYPDIKLCSDNAAMAASLGYYYATNNQALADPYTLDVEPSLSM